MDPKRANQNTSMQNQKIKSKNDKRNTLSFDTG